MADIDTVPDRLSILVPDALSGGATVNRHARSAKGVLNR